jgi:hypothetical protein
MRADCLLEQPNIRGVRMTDPRILEEQDVFAATLNDSIRDFDVTTQRSRNKDQASPSFDSSLFFQYWTKRWAVAKSEAIGTSCTLASRRALHEKSNISLRFSAYLCDLCV